jgi:exopolyphosphatase / guanosine-5'-triphosphate,3'-diphosphate pyrophosphatase
VTRVAGIDCGTNSIRLLVADADDGRLVDVVREMRIVRLGQDVDRTGRLADAALERVFAAVDEYAGLIDDHHVDALRFCATSAARDADNSAVFMDGVRSRLGVEPEVLTGDEEAQLSFAGATRSLGPDVSRPVVVIDIGGGSTELVLGDLDGEVAAARSLDIGSVRLTERLMPSDPPTAAEIDATTRAIDEALDGLPDAGVHLESAGTVIGVAGTVTTVAAVVLGLETYDRTAVHHSSLAASDVGAVTRLLLGMTAAERVELHIQPGRADVIAAGALILERVLARAGVPRVLVSESDILDGIAWSLA